METLQMKSGKSMRKKYMIIFVLTFSNIVYMIPYLSYDFYNQFLEAYGITDGQLGMLITFFGFTAVPGYFIGGWLADIFNPKKMVVASCIGTAAVAICVAFTTSYTILTILYFLYGITGTVLNWGAYLKVVRMLGEDDEQGRMFGMTDIAYSIFNLLLQYGILALTVTLLANNPMGFKAAILIYAAMAIAVGIAIYMVVPNNGNVKSSGEDSIKLGLIGKAVKMPLTWYLSFFTLGYFILRSTLPYINPYLTAACGVSVTFATAFNTTARFVPAMFFSPLGGAIRDRLGGRATPVIMVGASGTIIFSLLLAFIPQTAAMSTPIMIVAMTAFAFTAVNSSCLYTPMAEGKVPLAYTGTVMGIASAVGYSSDLWLYTVCGGWIDKFGTAGYTYIWYIAAGGGVLMLLTGLLLWTEYKKVRARTGQEEVLIGEDEDEIALA